MRQREMRGPVLVSLAVVGIAVAMRVYGLGWVFDHDNYDEGVYWQTLRAMHAGLGLYEPIFHAQPPLFMLLVYPFYALFGQSIVAARAGIAVLSLLGLLGAAMTGKALAGRSGALAAMILLAVSPLYLGQSQTLEAEGPATAFLFLSVGAALLWWKRPVGKAAVRLAIVSGAALSIGILIKLLTVTAGVPILMLILGRIWQSRRLSRSERPAMLMPILAAVIAALAVASIALMPFRASVGALWDQVVSYHLAASKVSESDTIEILGRFFATNGVLAVAALVGAVLAFRRRDWRVVPLLAWLTATLAVLATLSPLFTRHAIVLVPPLIALTVLGLSELTSLEHVLEILRARTLTADPSGWLMGLLVCAAVVAGVVGSLGYYRQLRADAESSRTQDFARMAADLRWATTPEQWIITDGQFVAAQADRDTPPSLVDTSQTRIRAGYLTTQQLLEDAGDPRVHAVLFATGRLASERTAGFHDWVSQHFTLAGQYGAGLELWVR